MDEGINIEALDEQEDRLLAFEDTRNMIEETPQDPYVQALLESLKPGESQNAPIQKSRSRQYQAANSDSFTLSRALSLIKSSTSGPA